MPRVMLILCFWLLCGNARACDTLCIYFATGKSDADSSARDSVRAFLKQYRNGDSLFVNGYADEPGSTQLNLDLSKQRAQAVARLLHTGGVPAALIKIKGMGRADNTPGANEKDRRTEIIIRRACGGSIKDDKVNTWIRFNIVRPEDCVMEAIAELAGQLELDPMKQLYIKLYRMCPKCRIDGTLPKDSYPLLEEKDMIRQRKKTISNYLRDKNIDPARVTYYEGTICFKQPDKGLEDKASAAVPFRMQGRLQVSLSGR